MRKKTDEFYAESEDGRRYLLVVYTDMIDASSKDSGEFIPGIKSLFTSDGLQCNHINDDTFQIIESDLILKRVK